MANKPDFLDSLFDVNGDGKVDDIDFMDDYAIHRMMREDEEAEKHKNQSSGSQVQLQKSNQPKKDSGGCLMNLLIIVPFIVFIILWFN